MSAAIEFALDAYGQSVSGYRIPIGSTVRWTITCRDDLTRNVLNLTGEAVKMSLCSLDDKRRPVQPPIFTRQATLTDAVHGVAFIPWGSGDTVPGGVPVEPGRYFVDVVHVAANGDQEPLLTLDIELTAVGTLPGALVSALPSQEPLGQGAAGASGLPDLETFALNVDQPMPFVDVDSGLTVTTESSGRSEFWTIPTGKTQMRVKHTGTVRLKPNNGLPVVGWFELLTPGNISAYPVLVDGAPPPPADGGVYFAVTPGDTYQVACIFFNMSTQGGAEPMVAGQFAAQFDVFFS